MTWRQVVAMWQAQDAALERVLKQTLCDCPFQDFFWECSPVSAQTIEQPFEFVLTDADGCLCGASSSAQDFAEHFTSTCACDQSHDADATVISFPNLGHDAMLVVPRHAPDASSCNLCAYANPPVPNDSKNASHLMVFGYMLRSSF